jgi:glutamate 5-kinase
MSAASEILRDSKKIVIKVGSHVLAGDDGVLSSAAVKNIVDTVILLSEGGKQVVVVSSGAGISGAAALGRLSRKNDINYKQALCAVGQVELMLAYKNHFAGSAHSVGQILLTAENFTDELSLLNIRNTLFTLLDEGVVPIINENDSVSTKEISLGDNDHLAALTANLWSADLLIIMSNVDGVYDSSPESNKKARLIPEVRDIDELTKAISTAGKSDFGTGGMDSKIEAARAVGAYGAPLLIVNGKRSEPLAAVIAGEPFAGTIFIPKTGK